MGACASSARAGIEAHREAKVARRPEHALQEVAAGISPEVDGKKGHLHIKPTPSGRILLGSGDEPMNKEELSDLKTILEENPDTLHDVHDLMAASKMGLHIRASRSPAFLGLLVVEVRSAVLLGFRHPAVQIACEDDKSKYIRHVSLSDGSDTNGVAVVAEGAPDPDAVSATPQPLERSSTSNSERERQFAWKDAVYVFVIVFSQAQFQVKVKEKAVGLGSVIARGNVPIKSLVQGDGEHMVPVMLKGKQVGVVAITTKYTYLRNTMDKGSRFNTDRLTVDPRKLRNLRNLVSHVSNVNHWMLSHDNVWAALAVDHPEVMHLRRQRSSGRRDPPALLDSAGQPHGSSHARSDSLGRDSLGRSHTRSDSAGHPIEPVAVGHDSGSLSASSTGSKHRWQTTCRRIMDGNLDDDEAHVNPNARMFEYVVCDGLCPSEDESGDVRALKSQMAGIMMMLNERMAQLEDTVTEQQQTIMDLEFKVGRATGSATVVPYISGRFGYGLGRPASKRDVLLFSKIAQVGPEPEKWPCIFLGKYKTDASGKLGPVPVPEAMVTSPGHYNIIALLPEDNTFARGSLFILKPGTQCVLFDMDGTITVGDEQVVTQFALNAVAASTDVGDRVLTQAYDQKARAHAKSVVRLWAAKGYQPIYLSGRQGSFYNLTLQWLIKHNYPPGPIHLTRSRTPTLPIYLSVGNFKVQYMEGLKKRGFQLYAAYGNTGTDVRAYEAAGIPKSRTFTIGQAAGASSTVRVDNFTEHLKEVLALPDATVPIAYVDLLWAALPQHSDGRKRAKQEPQTCGTLDPYGPDGLPSLSASSGVESTDYNDEHHDSLDADSNDISDEEASEHEA